MLNATIMRLRTQYSLESVGPDDCPHSSAQCVQDYRSGHCHSAHPIRQPEELAKNRAGGQGLECQIGHGEYHEDECGECGNGLTVIQAIDKLGWSDEFVSLSLAPDLPAYQPESECHEARAERHDGQK